MVRKIVKKGHKALSQKAKPIKNFKDPEFQALVKDLGDTIKDDDNAAGLAAPQIGVSKQVFAVKRPETGVKVFVNPEITHYSNKQTYDQEACLSVPTKAGLVPRSRKIVIKAYTPEGEKFKQTVKGFLARVLQHEYDHLQGKLYLERAERVTNIKSTESNGREI